jgi:hypothetical protein
MFPLRVKDHPMEIRGEEMFVVYHANTERLKKSPKYHTCKGYLTRIKKK